MKHFLSLILLCSLSALSTAQEESFNDFKREFNYRDGIRSFTIPGFLVRLVGNIAIREEEPIDRETIRPLMRNIGSVSFLFTEDNSRITKEIVSDLRHNLMSEGFTPLIKIKDENSRVEILSWDKKNVIRRLVFLIQEDDDETLLLNIRGHFTQRDIDDFIDSLQKRKKQI